MACVNPDGTLTDSGRAMLSALRTTGTPEQVAAATGLPLFRVRSGLREMMHAALVEEQQGSYRLTERGATVAPPAGA